MADPALVVACAVAAGTLVGSGATALGVIRQDRRLVRAAGLDSLWRMVETWDNSGMQRRRAEAAVGLLADPRRFDHHTEAVLNVFEFLGYLLRTRTITEDDAWTNFSQWAVCYWFACETDIRPMREADSTIYEDFAWLVQRMRRVEVARRRGISFERTAPTAEAVTSFLQSEARVTELGVAAPEVATQSDGDVCSCRDHTTRWWFARKCVAAILRCAARLPRRGFAAGGKSFHASPRAAASRPSSQTVR
jgi:hypothetical protein